MHRYFSALYKEFLLLIRDRAGVIILFVMPVMLVSMLTVIEGSVFNVITGNQVPVVFVDHDNDSLGSVIRHSLYNSRSFTIYDIPGNRPDADQEACNAVYNGDYAAAVIIPAGSSDTLRRNAREIVKKLFRHIGVINDTISQKKYDSVRIELRFDPAARGSVKAMLDGYITSSTSVLQSKMVFEQVTEVLKMLMPAKDKISIDYPDVVRTDKKFALDAEAKISPNVTQHNVPSWTLFSMFLIVIPLAGSIILEKGQGAYIRLNIMPRTRFVSLFAKLSIYLLVCILQVILLFGIGVYAMKFMGLPALNMGSHWIALGLLVFATSLAAVAFGVLIGYISNTFQQAAAVGVTIVIVFSALGGIWMPLFLMPPGLAAISSFTPINWALNGFYDIFLRDAGIARIFPNALKLIFFALSAFIITYIYRRYKKAN